MFFNKKNFCIGLLATAVATLPLSASEHTNKARVVDFGKCYMESEYGKKEQANLNMMKEQMEKAMKELNDQLTETSEKLNDEFVRDSLSPEAEKELQAKMQTLSGEMQRYQQQYYYMLQQANMKTMNVIADKVKEASSTLANKHGYSLVMNQEQVFHYTADLDVTEDVIATLNDMFSKENANQEKVKSELSKGQAK